MKGVLAAERLHVAGPHPAAKPAVRRAAPAASANRPRLLPPRNMPEVGVVVRPGANPNGGCGEGARASEAADVGGSRGVAGVWWMGDDALEASHMRCRGGCCRGGGGGGRGQACGV